MASPSHPVLQRLDGLKRSSSDFHDQLSNVLYAEEYKQYVSDLRGDDLVWLVDYLDEVLDTLSPSSTASQECLRELRSICGTRTMLPTSYILSPYPTSGPNPFASGGYGDVYDGTLGDSRVYIKRVRVYTKDDTTNATKAICREAVAWKRLKHPNVVPLLGITIAPLQLVSNWMSGGDLPGYIKKHPDADRLGLLCDVAKGLEYLHAFNVVHGDLKGQNVLVDDSGCARIADFGLAGVTQNLDSIQGALCQHGDTPRWSAPEVLKGGAYSKEADIFSFAMVMTEMFTGAIPFNDGSSFVAMLAITQGKRPPRPTHPTFTENLWTLMQRCWDPDPHSRPEISEVLRTLPVPEEPAWKRLISHTLATHERISLIATIFSDDTQVEMVGQLAGGDVQTFVDTIDGTLEDLAPEIRRSCLHYLRRICGDRALLPTSLKIPLCYDPADNPVSHSGFSDVWKGQYNGGEVAAKVLRIYTSDELERIRKRFCREVVTWKALRHPNVLPLLGVMTESRFVMVSEWMRNGNINKFVEANADADRLGLLGDVTRGLIHMHDQGIIHGNLKGANVLINDNGRACLADFNLLTLASDPQIMASSVRPGGAFQWTSPERLFPEEFGLKDGRATKESDCYSLGMVVYEVLAGQRPFHQYSFDALIIEKILGGERPERPQGAQGARLTNELWGTLELCWKPQPGDRPSLDAVLQCLQGVTRPSRPPFDIVEHVETDTSDQHNATGSNSGPPITHGDNGLPFPPLASPGITAVLKVPQDRGQFPGLSKTGNRMAERVERFSRSAWKIFKAATRKLFGL